MSLFTAETYLLFIAIGIGVGIFGTLIGAGGGFVLMPLLLMFYPEETPEKLTSISLAIVFFNALSGSEAYAKMKRIDYKSGLLFAGATIPGAILGALNTGWVPRRLFDLIFSLLLIISAVVLTLKPNLIRGRQTPEASMNSYHHKTERHMTEVDGRVFDYSFNPVVGLVISLFVGYVSSFLGIGGGIIHVPALVYFLNFPVHIATATSHFILVIMSLTGTIVHILTGAFAHGVHHMVSLALGVVLGAQLGAPLSNVVKDNWIMRSLAAALGLAGIQIFASVIG